MFTGIVEATGAVAGIEVSGKNITFTISSSISSQLKVDQSVAHDGVCLTVTSIMDDKHKVTAIDETLKKTRLTDWQKGTMINLERSLTLTSLVDGHLVQGHVDAVAVCENVTDANGSRILIFRHPEEEYFITVPKGSVCVNGVSLTVVDSGKDYFSVALIPYTLEHTNLKEIKSGSRVNVEFDIIGKYVKRLRG
ncbi:MAG: riboflavin synthase [Bacteroidia bacterium]|nr:riboflavin synthase [Bacteroidia bacterium]